MNGVYWNTAEGNLIVRFDKWCLKCTRIYRSG